MPAGLEERVEFWKQIFSKHSVNDVVLFDPRDPGTIYSVLRGGNGEPNRQSVDRERARIAASYDLVDDESRVRSQRGAKEDFAAGLRISGRYLSQMQRVLREEGVPAELAYLPLVESSFNIHARSSAGAVGMWQFIPETGKKFLRIDSVVDERRDPMISTRAAARLLKQNYQILGSWPLAITAYNHGTEGIFNGIKAVGSRDLVELIRKYQSPYWDFASQNFYAEFLAVVLVANRSDEYFPFLRRHAPVSFQEVVITRALPTAALLKSAGIVPKDFFHWNPALEQDAKAIPSGYRVNLPPERVGSFVAAQRLPMIQPAARRGLRGKSAVASAKRMTAPPSVKRPQSTKPRGTKSAEALRLAQR
jgi:membrane-bound lytic murein transglycosylase D